MGVNKSGQKCGAAHGLFLSRESVALSRCRPLVSLAVLSLSPSSRACGLTCTVTTPTPLTTSLFASTTSIVTHCQQLTTLNTPHHSPQHGRPVLYLTAVRCVSPVCELVRRR